MPTAYNLTVVSLVLKKTKLKKPSLVASLPHVDPVPFPYSPLQQNVVNGFPLNRGL